ncbi:MAG: hypothetical protein DRG31_06920, partial [Deltaproteobacteria bacterium]
YIWPESKIEPSTDDIFLQIEELEDHLKRVAYYVIYAILDQRFRKLSSLWTVFSLNEVKLPNSRDRIEKYRELADKVVKTIIDRDKLEAIWKLFEEMFVRELKKLVGEEISLLVKVFKYHLEGEEIFEEKGRIGKANACVICGRKGVKTYEVKVATDVPIKDLASNFYVNIISSKQELIKMCECCYAEFRLKKVLFEREIPENTYFIHIMPTPYIPIISLKVPSAEIRRISLGGQQIEIQGEIVNPMFLYDTDKALAFAYFMVAAPFRASRDTLEQYYRGFVNALSWAKLGFRTYVSRTFSALVEEKAYMFFDPMYGDLLRYFGDGRFGFYDVSILDLKVRVVEGLRKASDKRASLSEIISHLSTHPISAFHFLMREYVHPKRKNIIKEVGEVVEEFVKKMGESSIVKVIEELADIYSNYEFINLESRNSRTWPMRDAMDTFIKWYRSGKETVKAMISSQILKGLERGSLESRSKIAEDFAEKFIQLWEFLGDNLLKPMLRTHIIDAFDYFVVKKVLEKIKAGKK